MSAVATLVGVAGPALAAIGAGWSGSRFIQEGQRGIKTRVGRAVMDRKTGQPKVIKPGFSFIIPKIDALYRTHVRDRTIAFDPQRVMLKDNTVFDVNAIILLHVNDTSQGVYDAIFTVDDFEGSVADFCSAALRDVVQTCNHEQLADPVQIAQQVRDAIEPQLSRWGAIVMDFRLSDCSPVQGSAEALLKKKVAQFNAEALQAACEALNTDPNRIDPTLAAALIGHSVSVNLGAGSSSNNGASHVSGA